jgi:hypothetical protein
MSGKWTKRKSSSLQHLQVWQHNKQAFGGRIADGNKKDSLSEEARLAIEKLYELQKKYRG